MQIVSDHLRSTRLRDNSTWFLPLLLSVLFVMSLVTDDDDGPPELVDVAALPDSEKPTSLKSNAADDPGSKRVPITLVTGRLTLQVREGSIWALLLLLLLLFIPL